MNGIPAGYTYHDGHYWYSGGYGPYGLNTAGEPVLLYVTPPVAGDTRYLITDLGEFLVTELGDQLVWS